MSVLNVTAGKFITVAGIRRKVFAVYPVKGARWFLVNDVNGNRKPVIYSNSHVFA